MKKYTLILFLFLPFFSLKAEEDIPFLSQQAEALWEAHDYTSASKIYEPLLSLSLPSWQQARLLYNLGTIRLSQHQPTEALALFKKILPFDLSVPRFGCDLFLNEGIADLQYAQTPALVTPLSLLDEQIFFIKQGLKAFEKAQILDCQIQQTEQQESPSACHFNSLIEKWTKAAHVQLTTLHQQKNQKWIQQATTETLASFLHNYLLEFLQHFKDFQSQEKQKQEDAPFTLYFQHQVESFIPIWNVLQEKEFSLSQKTAFDQALAFYLNAQQALNQQNSSSFSQELNQSIEALVPLIFQKNHPLQQAHLNYEIILLQEPLLVSPIQKLLVQLTQLKVEKNQNQLLEQIKNSLQASLDELKSKQVSQARFFLLAGFSQLTSLMQEKQTSPTIILQRAMEQANRALQASFLLASLSENSLTNAQNQPLLNNQQQQVLTQAAFFIPAVLQEQNRRFQQAHTLTTGCQQSPWDQVIPLFDHGYQAALQAETQSSTPSLALQSIIDQQKQTVKNWQQALYLIQHPPLQNQQTSSQTPSAATSQPLTETYRLIQEMFLEDQPPSAPQTQELHSW